MIVGSLFTGVGGFDLGFERAGMRIAFQCEIDAWCRGILAQHWPDIPCFEDVREVSSRSWRRIRSRQVDGDGHRTHTQRVRVPFRSEDACVDLLCGGSPCQDVSVAGLRRGLAGERSGLFFEFVRVADELVRPGGWIVFENVPGLLSSNGGRDFAVVLRSLGDIGFHDLAWRVLDSRYFGVPQRRRRVFIVGRRAAGDSAQQVLLEPESGGGNFAPSSQARPRVANCLSKGSRGSSSSSPGRRQEDDWNIVNALDRRQGGADDNDAQGGHLVTGTIRSHIRPGSADPGGTVIAPALVKRYAKGTDSDATDALIAHTLRAEGFDASEDGTGRGTPLTVTALDRGIGIEGDGSRVSRLVSPTSDAHGVRTASGLPGRVDDPQPDGPRYSAMGNAVTVNVLEWIGRRVMAQENDLRMAA